MFVVSVVERRKNHKKKIEQEEEGEIFSYKLCLTNFHLDDDDKGGWLFM